MNMFTFIVNHYFISLPPQVKSENRLGGNEVTRGGKKILSEQKCKEKCYAPGKRNPLDAPGAYRLVYDLYPPDPEG